MTDTAEQPEVKRDKPHLPLQKSPTVGGGNSLGFQQKPAEWNKHTNQRDRAEPAGAGAGREGSDGGYDG